MKLSVALIIVVLALGVGGVLWYNHTTSPLVPNPTPAPTPTPPPMPSPSPTPTPTSGTSGITGVVLLGPTCPVMRDPPDPQCADKPYQTTIFVAQEASSYPTQSFQTDKNGRFLIALKPGRYTVDASGAVVYPRCASETVEVTAGQYTKVNISCDTGIR